MTDHELLELAAKAAAYQVWIEPRSPGCQFDSERELYLDVRGSKAWNPLADGGDAFRLMVTLNMHIAHYAYKPDYVLAGIENRGLDPDHIRDDSEFLANQDVLDDPAATTRRAIVIAAAEIGKNIGQPN